VATRLLLRSTRYRRTERGSQKLAAKADSQDGPSLAQGVLDQADFLPQKRIFVLFINAHRPAHHNQTGMITEAARNRLTLEWADEVEGDVASLERLSNQAGRFHSHVLNDIQSAHGFLR
jgi:hypothetical protein